MGRGKCARSFSLPLSTCLPVSVVVVLLLANAEKRRESLLRFYLINGDATGHTDQCRFMSAAAHHTANAGHPPATLHSSVLETHVFAMMICGFVKRIR
jgi:hypothetical protein